MARFELQEFSGRFRFSLRSAQRGLVLTSEFYPSKRGAEQGVLAVKKNASVTDHYARRMSPEGEPFFAMTDDTGTIIALSEMFPSAVELESGIDFVRQHAGETPVDDLTP